MELAKVEAEMRGMIDQGDKDFRQQLEQTKEQAKDERIQKQAVEQSKLISQRKGERGEIKPESEELMEAILGGQQQLTQQES